MPSQIATIGDAVVDFLNDAARGYSQAFEAVRQYAPDGELSNPDPAAAYALLEDLNVFVWSTTRNRSFANTFGKRGAAAKTYAVQIGVMQSVPQPYNPDEPGGNDFIDALALLCEEIDDSFPAGLPLGSFRLLADDTDIAIDAQAIRSKVFMGVITLQFIAI